MKFSRLSSQLSVGCALLLGAVGLAAQDAPARQKAYVLYAAEPQTVVAGKQTMVALRFHVVDGYHVNSHTPKEDFLIPTALKLETSQGVTAGAIEYPPGHEYSFSFDPKEKLDVYQGDFTVKVPLTATAGEHTVDGTLRYQACDNAACYPPRSVAVKLIFNAK